MFKTRNRKELDTVAIVLESLISLLDKKQIITRKDIQDEIVLRSENHIQMVGDIEYKL